MPEDMTFEAARDELAQIVTTLEQGGLSLEQSLELWERGEVLTAVCQRWLDTAQRRLADHAPGEDAVTDLS